MIWTILIAIIGFIITRFLLDRKKQNEKLIKEGGVRNKYSKLIELLEDNSKPTVFQSDLDTYLFGWITPNADSRFRIMQTFGSVTIKWQLVGRVVFETINLSKEWKFQETAEQEKMAEIIAADIKEVMDNSILGGF